MPPLQPVSTAMSLETSKDLFPSDTFSFGSLSLPPKKKQSKETVFLTDEEAYRGIAPQEISRGMRSYSCTREECKHLHFSTLEGPDSVKEHIAMHHRE